jgi:hypothetical protein
MTRAFGCHHGLSRRTRLINVNSRCLTSQKFSLENISVLRNIPRYLPEVFHIDGTDLTAQVAQTYYRPVPYTLGNCISIIGSHKPDLASRQIIINMTLNLVHVKQLRWGPAAKPHCLACAKNYPPVEDP